MAVDKTQNIALSKPNSADTSQTEQDLIDSVSDNATICDFQINRLNSFIQSPDNASIGRRYIVLYPNTEDIYFMPNGKIVIRGYNSTSTSNTPADLYVTGNIFCDGNFHAGGTQKTRVVKTEHYGKRCLNAVESAEANFIDKYKGTLIKGKCKISIDPVWAETVDLSLEYDVQICKYGKGDIWVDKSSMTEKSFIVEGDNDIEFTAFIIAKQIGATNLRLQELDGDK